MLVRPRRRAGPYTRLSTTHIRSSLIVPATHSTIRPRALEILTPQVLLKILKHSTDPLPPAPQTNVQQDRNPPPQTALSSRPDAIGVLLGMDLDGVMEVEDCFALPGGETGLGREFVHSDLQVRSDGGAGEWEDWCVANMRQVCRAIVRNG